MCVLSSNPDIDHDSNHETDKPFSKTKRSDKMTDTCDLPEENRDKGTLFFCK